MENIIYILNKTLYRVDGVPGVDFQTFKAQTIPKMTNLKTKETQETKTILFNKIHKRR